MANLFFSRNFISQFYTLVCSDIVLFFSFVFSHPLYFSYIVFFSPYLLRFLYFHSPLVITIILLLLALIYDSFTCKLYEPGSSFLLSTMHAVLDRMSPLSVEDFDDFEQFEVYKYVFLFDKTSSFDVSESSIKVLEPEYEEKYCLEDVDQVLVLNSSFLSTTTPFDEVAETTKLPLMEEEEVNSPEKKFDKVVEVKKEMSNFRGHCYDNKEECPKNVPLCTESQNKIAKGNATSEGGGVYATSLSSKNLGSYGSMRNEKEWKRTLACKLYEERHNVVEGDEGMDSLWETYESDLIKSKRKDEDVKKKKKSSEVDYNYDSEDEDDEIEMRNGHLCCLQALKFSTRKMNPSFVKISKVLKGVGWLRHVKRQNKINHHKFA